MDREKYRRDLRPGHTWPLVNVGRWIRLAISKFGKKFPEIVVPTTYHRDFGTIALGFRRSQDPGEITNRK